MGLIYVWIELGWYESNHGMCESLHGIKIRCSVVILPSKTYFLHFPPFIWFSIYGPFSLSLYKYIYIYIYIYFMSTNYSLVTLAWWKEEISTSYNVMNLHVEKTMFIITSLFLLWCNPWKAPCDPLLLVQWDCDFISMHSYLVNVKLITCYHDIERFC